MAPAIELHGLFSDCSIWQRSQFTVRAQILQIYLKVMLVQDAAMIRISGPKGHIHMRILQTMISGILLVLGLRTRL